MEDLPLTEARLGAATKLDLRDDLYEGTAKTEVDRDGVDGHGEARGEARGEAGEAETGMEGSWATWKPALRRTELTMFILAGWMGWVATATRTVRERDGEAGGAARSCGTDGAGNGDGEVDGAEEKESRPCFTSS